MSRIPTISRKVTKKTSVGPFPPGTSAATSQQAPLGLVRPSSSQTAQGPSVLQKKIFKEALSKSALDPRSKVRSVGARTSQIAAPKTNTKRGIECVLQQLSVEKTVQRTPRGEYIGKTITSVDVDHHGKAKQLEITSQEIDPTHATESAGINTTISVTNNLTVTSGGKQTKKFIKKKVVRDQKTASKPNLNPAHISRLVIEEVEDVENTLKMVPPDLISTSIEKYPLKKKVQDLRLNAVSMAFLEHSVIHSEPTADEIDTEAPPEVMASLIHAVEKGAAPNSTPNQIFNSLFPDVHEEKMEVSSIGPGPLQDLVVPIVPPQRMTEEVLNEEMEQSVLEVQNAEELPSNDICTEKNMKAPERAGKKEHKKPMLLETEIPPWEEADVKNISTLVGGEPIDTLEATDVSILETSQIEQEMTNGIDFFLDADSVPFQSFVQIRGSKLPDWFPGMYTILFGSLITVILGYMSAFPHLPGLVKISRTPSEVLHSAWKAVQPKLFQEDSILVD